MARRPRKKTRAERADVAPLSVFLDVCLGRTDVERQAIMDAKAAVFVLTSTDMTGAEIAAAFSTALPRIRRLCGVITRPLIATVTRAGKVDVLVGERRGGAKNS